MTSKKISTKPGALVLSILVAMLSVGGIAMALERPQYSRVKSEPPYEVRDYGPAVIATVKVTGSRGLAVDSGFRLLAAYIFGNNQAKSKIAMTAPVTQRPDSRSSTDFAAAESLDSGIWTVRFMMPSGYTADSLPTPTDSRVHFEQSAAHRSAVIRFSGFWTDSNFDSHAVQLHQWMETQGLAPHSSPTFAYYDPPWTPWFMRTNEVMIDITTLEPSR